MLVESFGSTPAMTVRTMAASSAERARAPAWSRLDAKAIMPYRDTRPYVGLTPVTPVSAAGWRIEPPVSVPVVNGARRAAAAAADPPDDPPGTLPVSQGFLTGP